MKDYKYTRFWYFIGILVAANIAVWIFLARAEAQDFAKLSFFDVGQGDAIYLRTVQGNDVLIDGGPGDAVLSKLGKVMPFADRTIEFVVLTHPHADHLSGLIEILKRYRVETILLPRVQYASASYETFLALLEKEEARVIAPALGQRIFLDEATVFDIYYPVTREFTRLPKDINDVSIVGKISYGRNQILLTGDAGKDIEQFLLRLKIPLQAKILKVGHHGSRHSSSPEFLSAASSTFAIISVGPNRYGHPHGEVLGELQTANTEILRTDERGDVFFRIYPDRVELQD